MKRILIANFSEHIGQVRETLANNEVARMNQQDPAADWHIDRSAFLFCPNENENDLNPCPLSDGYVWITTSTTHSEII